MNWVELHCLIIILAILLDLVIGDPRWFPHPVILMGKAISFLEQRWNKKRNLRFKGIVLMITIVGSVLLIVSGILFLANKLHPILAIGLEVYFVSSTIAIKGLKQAGLKVSQPLEENNITQARQQLSYIVGRDTETLGEQEIVRGTVETIAENTVDGIIAPLVWALLGGAPLAMAYRAINTLDSMVGYKNERYLIFGWASARMDDLANLFPARLTALLMWLSLCLFPNFHRKNSLVIVRRDAMKHQSPNSGWPEAMVAGLLGVQLGGKNTYQGIVSYRKEMGDKKRALTPKDISLTIKLMHGSWLIFSIFILVLLLL